MKMIYSDRPTACLFHWNSSNAGLFHSSSAVHGTLCRIYRETKSSDFADENRNFRHLLLRWKLWRRYNMSLHAELISDVDDIFTSHFVPISTTLSTVAFFLPSNAFMNFNTRLRLLSPTLVRHCSLSSMLRGQWQQGLWRIEYLNTGRAKTAVCKQIGGRPCFYVWNVLLVCKMTCENYLVWL